MWWGPAFSILDFGRLRSDFSQKVRSVVGGPADCSLYSVLYDIIKNRKERGLASCTAKTV